MGWFLVNHQDDRRWSPNMEKCHRHLKLKKTVYVLERDFSATAPKQKWVTDITEFKAKDRGKVYLSPILDLFNNEIVSYNLNDSPNWTQVEDQRVKQSLWCHFTFRPRLAVSNDGLSSNFSWTWHHSKYVEKRVWLGQHRDGKFLWAIKNGMFL